MCLQKTKNQNAPSPLGRPAPAFAGEPDADDDLPPPQGKPAPAFAKDSDPDEDLPPLQGEPALAFAGDPEPFLETPSPGAEPALQPPSLPVPDVSHQHSPPPKIDFLPPVVVFICNFVVFFHIVYGILHFGF